MFCSGIIICGRRTFLGHIPVTLTGKAYVDDIIRLIVQAIRDEAGSRQKSFTLKFNLFEEFL